MEEMLADKTRDELIEQIEQLSLECDDRHAHEDQLEEQVKRLQKMLSQDRACERAKKR